MDAKLILFIIVIVLGVILNLWKTSERSKCKFYVISIISLLILESCLRSVDVGNDTQSYFNAFRDITNTSWSEIWDSFYEAYMMGSGKDPGFMVFMKLAQFVSKDFNVFLFICALVFFVPLGIILYRYSDRIIQLVFAFSLYLTLFHIVALSGVRQQLATGFTFMAFLFVGKQQYWKSVIFILLGSLIHVSATLFLFVPLLYVFGKKIIKTAHLASLVLVPAIALSSSSIMLYLASFLANDYYSGYGTYNTEGGAMTYIVLMSLLSLFCFIAIRKNALNENQNLSLFYVMLPLLTLTVPLTSLNGAMIRVGQYFTLYMTLLVPFAFDLISDKKSNSIFYLIAIVVLFVMSLRGEGLYYTFFWQNIAAI